MPSWQQPPPMHCFPLTDSTVLEFYEYLFAPWVKGLGIRDFLVKRGEVSAVLPQNDSLKFASGAVCGQVIMAAIDTVASLAMATTERVPKGTAYQHTHFIRPALNDDLKIEAKVLRFGKSSAFAEGRATSASSGEIVAHASLEFAF
jgi:acyl-coenzyme A thioesterase PaaI-like protein